MNTLNKTAARFTIATVLAIGFLSNAQARPTDPEWSPLASAPKVVFADRIVLKGPFNGPRSTIPSAIVHEPAMALAEPQPLRWVGGRSTIAIRL